MSGVVEVVDWLYAMTDYGPVNADRGNTFYIPHSVVTSSHYDPIPGHCH